jgi:hypothetical protein
VGEKKLGMNDTVYMLWFELEHDDCDDCNHLFIGVYTSESEAKDAIERVKGEKGFVSFPEGFHIYPYKLNEDHWREGFIVED